jgi:pyruvate dehydrogenase E2 component (dihydrolipoamide acetyltransferase)
VIDIKLPELGENIAQGTISKVLVKPGDVVKKGQNVLELETDKAVLEVPSPSEGTVKEVLVKAGQTVKVGQPVFKYEGGAAQAAAPAAQAAPSAPTPKAEAKAAPQPSAPQSAPVATGAVVEMKLPELGENIAQGTITKILVKVGDYVKKGQAVVELETDKAVLEVPSSMEGAIEEILLKAGQVAKVGQPAFKIKGSGSAAAPEAAKPSAPAASASAAPAAKTETKTTEVAAPVAGFTQQPAKPAKDVAAAPSVRRFAREIGIDITTVTGSGPGGRISVEDVKTHAKKILTALAQGQSPAGFAPKSVPLPDFAKWGQIERQPMNNVRKKTAEHLSHAWNAIPHVTQFDKADITELEKLRKSLSTAEKKLSITPFLIKTIAIAMKKFPQFNSSIDMNTQEIILKKYINVGVAVDTDRGLLVPVLKNVDQKSIHQINEELVAIAHKTRERKTSMDELQGGGFTLSNLGGIGGTFFTPIVNWPEVAILGASRGVMEQVYKDGKFEGRLLLPLSLSYDHRVIDGADGARFIRFICDTIEHPSEII